jgi:hypothetical protein
MEDERLAKIEQERQNAINSSNNTYNQLITDNQSLYDNQNKYAEEYERVTNENLDKQLAFNESKIEQQKEEARKSKETEDKKALNDYTAYVNPYGYQAESMANSGLNNSGVSETAKLGAYNTYQNRLANSNKVLQDAITEYDNSMNEARLTNDVTKAQNALSKLQMQLEYQQNYMSNKSTITQNQLSNNQSLDSDFYNRYQTEYANIQNEKAQAENIRQWEAEMAEKQRQYNESLAYQKEQDKLSQANWEKEYALSKQSLNSSKKSEELGGSGGTGGSETLENTTSGNGVTIKANPYTNTINPDAKNGVFSNGYQPNNVDGNPLEKSKYTVGQLFYNAVNNLGNDMSKQSIWQCKGKYYVWNGSINDYIDVTDDVKFCLKNNVSKQWGI